MHYRFPSARLALCLGVLLSATPIATPAAGDEPPAPRQVIDLVTEAVPRTPFRTFASSYVPFPDDAGGGLLYFADDGARGTELWITDGSESGTRLWAEVCPGRCRKEGTVQETGATIFDGQRAFFLANDGLHGLELWTSDGTPEGTRLVADLVPGPMDAGIRHLSLIHGRLYFAASVGGLGFEPWVSDGTAEGTRSLGDLAPGPGGSYPEDFLPLGDEVVFQAFSEDFGNEWWQTDGTPQGTRRATDLCPGTCSATTANPIAFGDAVLFSTEPGADEETLWSLAADGSVEPLADLCPGACDNLITFLHPVGDLVYFGKLDRLWRTDGTPGGTRPIATLPADARRVDDVVEVAGRTLVVFDLVSFAGQLWRLANTATTARLDGPLLETAGRLSIASRGDLALVSNSHSEDPGLFRTDGTRAGTARLRPLDFSPVRSRVIQPLTADERFVLSAPTNPTRGPELWTSDGTGPGTYRLEQERLERTDSLPRELVALGAGVIFTAATNDSLNPAYPLRELWTSDGTADGTFLLAGGSRLEPRDLESVRVGQQPMVFFNADDEEDGREPWVSDGTVAGTASLGNLQPEDATSWPREPVAFDGRLVFLADQELGQKIWVSDGSAAGTELLVDVEPEWFNDHVGCSVCSPPGPPGPIFPRQLAVLDTAAGERLAFVARANGSGSEVWTSDGSVAGTGLLRDLRPGEEGSRPTHLTVVSRPHQGDLLFFVADDGEGRALWVSDGTPETTGRLLAVATVPPELLPPYALDNAPPPAFGILDTAALAGGLVWLERTVTGEGRLGVSDGTPTGSGTAVILPAGAVSSGQLTAIGNRLYLAVVDGSGAELWTSDLTAAGTRRVADLWPGPKGSAPEELLPVGGRLYFTADDGLHGRELWRLARGVPQRVADLAPGAAPSSPNDLTAAGGLLFFGADDGDSGREPWVLPLAESPFGCEEDGTVHCLGGGRFRVNTRWRVPATGQEGVGRTLERLGDSGLFWFFGADNVELVVKVLDGRELNDHFWLFYGGLSDVEYWVDVEDLATGSVRTWYNPPGNLCGQGDVTAFPGLDAPGIPPMPAQQTTPATRPVSSDPAQGSGESLHLQDGRFTVSVEWRTADAQGVGRAVPATEESGLFWFFSPGNLELAVKILDGRPLNGRFWFFYGALSDVEYTIWVHDTETGAEREYHNPAGNLCGGADVQAF